MTTTQIDAWRPNRDIELLIRVAFADDDQAHKAWDEWSSRNDINKLNGATLRLLPLLFRRMAKLGIDHPAMAIIGKSYRRTWATNLTNIRTAEKLVEDLGTHGIPTILFKGLAMVVHYYPDPGMRAMADIDIAIPVEDSDAAIQVFLDSGWHPARRPIEQLSAH